MRANDLNRWFSDRKLPMLVTNVAVGIVAGMLQRRLLKEMVGTRRLEPFHAGTYPATR